MNTPTVLNIALHQGASWLLSFEWLDADGLPVDLTGCSAKMQLRRASDKYLVLELSTANARITLGSGTGIITMTLDAATTATLTCQDGLYDMLVTHPDAQVDRVIYGAFTLTLAITQ